MVMLFLVRFVRSVRTSLCLGRTACFSLFFYVRARARLGRVFYTWLCESPSLSASQTGREGEKEERATTSTRRTSC